MSRFNIGDRVIFVKNTRAYSIGPNNPLQGTKYACAGTISCIRGKYVDVIWDNGKINDYDEETLDFYEDLQLVEIPSLASILEEL